MTENDEVFRTKEAVLLSQFDNSIATGWEFNSDSKGLINQLVRDIRNLEREYLEDLSDRRSSYGLYGVGEFDNDFNNSETRYLAGLKWRLFNNGYYEAIRVDSKKVLQTQLEFYQLRRDMVDRQLADDLFTLFSVENQVSMSYQQEKMDSLLNILVKRVKQLQHGYTTELDVLDIRRQYEKSRDSFRYYEKSDRSGISKEQLALLNQIESIHLKPLSQLLELTKNNSFDLKIQDNFIERSEFFPSWLDDVSVNIDAEYKREYYEKDRSILGFEIEIPLIWDTNRHSLIKTQRRIYEYQKQAINLRLNQQLEKLASFYRFQQYRLMAQQGDIEILLQKTSKALVKTSNIIQNLDSDPARNIDLLAINLLDARYEALKIRLKLYEILLKLMAMIQAEDISALCEFH